MKTETKLNSTWDGEVVVGKTTVLVHNAICQPRDSDGKRIRPATVAAAQKAVDALYETGHFMGEETLKEFEAECRAKGV